MKRIVPTGFIGKDILAVEKEVKPVIEDSKGYRQEVAREFRRAVETLKMGLLHESAEPVPAVIDDWLRSAWRGSSKAAERPQQESEITR
jgi:hypothetical protein